MKLTEQQLIELSACCDEAETKTTFADQWAIMELWMHVKQRDLPVWLSNKFGMVYLRLVSSSVTGIAPEPSSVKLPAPITPEEIAWTNLQPMIGTPSLTRLRLALQTAGLRPVELVLNDDGENIEFRLERGPTVRHMDREQTLRTLIATFRGSGFEVGYTELAVADFDDQSVYGMSLVAPLEQVCEHGPVPVER